MPYDAASFKAGFAVGRMLWRPPYYTTQYIDTGIGWRAKADYLRWTQADIMGTYEPGVFPSYIQTEYYNTGHKNVFSYNGQDAVWVEFTDVVDPVYWMFTEGHSSIDGKFCACVIAVSASPFSMNMRGYGSAHTATKPPSYYDYYMSAHDGFGLWSDCYGIVMGWRWDSYPQYGGFWYTPVSWDSVTSTALHNAVLQYPQIKTVKKTNDGISVNAFVKFPVSGTYKYVGVGLSTKASYAQVQVDNTLVSSTTRTKDGLTFTMYYTDQIDENMNLLPYVPVITVSSMPSISDLSDYQTALFNAVVGAAGVEYVPTDTGLGWAANINYLVNINGTKIATVSGRVFTKSGTGYAIAVNCKNSNGWSGPALFSTVEANTDYTPPGGVAGGSSTTYLGMTWYMSQPWYWFQGSISNAGGMAPDYDFTGVPQTIEDMLPLVCAAAGVTVTGGGS